MSKTITLSLKDEEHILTVDPGDNFISLLESTLGNTNSYTYSVNGKQVASAVDLVKQLSNNMIINVEYSVRGTALSVGPAGTPIEIKSQRNPARPTIKIETVHISCSSDSFDPKKNMAGFIIYSFDNQQKFELNGHRCRTGYILIKETDNIEHIPSNDGVVHGKLFKWFFGSDVDERFIGAGFSWHKEKLKFNSSVFNAKDDDYHDMERTLSENEIHLIKYVIEVLYKNHTWRQNPTLSAMAMDRKNFSHWKHVPPQNYPKPMTNEDFC